MKDVKDIYYALGQISGVASSVTEDQANTLYDALETIEVALKED